MTTSGTGLQRFLVPHELVSTSQHFAEPPAECRCSAEASSFAYLTKTRAFRYVLITKGETALGLAKGHIVLHLRIKVFSIALDVVH